MSWIETNKWDCLDEEGELVVVIEETQMHEADPPIRGLRRLMTTTGEMVNKDGAEGFCLAATGEHLRKRD